MKFSTSSLLFLFFCSTSFSQKTNLFIEQPLTNTENINPYNYDNKIFTSTQTYIYDYMIIKNSDTLRYKIMPDSNGSKRWEYVPFNTNDSSTITFLGISALEKVGPILLEHPDYKQTEIVLYEYNLHYKTLDKELTGVIENSKNIWLHPFRMNAFQILQLSPFPYVKFPFEEKKYYWNLKIGKHWKEFTIFKWKGKLNLKCEYQERKEEFIQTAFGKIPTMITTSIGKTKLGNSYLTSYFNKDVGFVKLIYDNIDKSKIILTLKEIKTDL